MKQTSLLDLAYIAGLVDGEGHIGLAKGKRKAEHHNETYMPNVTITNTNMALLLHVKAITGIGDITTSSRGERSNWKARSNWYLRGEEQVVFLQAIRSFLIIKNQQANLLIEFHSLINDPGQARTLSEEAVILRDVIYQELAELNKRGTE